MSSDKPDLIPIKNVRVINFILVILLLWGMISFGSLKLFFLFAILLLHLIQYIYFFGRSKKEEFSFIKEIQTLNISLWISTLLMYSNTSINVLVWFNLIIFLGIVSCQYIIIKTKINTWWKFLLIIIFMFFINFMIFGFGLVILQLAYQLGDVEVVLIIYIITIITPILLSLIENDEKALKRLKVGVYAWIAILTSASAITYLYQEDIEGFAYETVVLNMFFNVEESDLDDFFSDSENVKELETLLAENKNFRHISFRKSDGDYLSGDQISIKVASLIKDKISSFLTRLFMLIFLPHIIGGVCCFFIFEWKELRKLERSL